MIHVLVHVHVGTLIETSRKVL